MDVRVFRDTVPEGVKTAELGPVGNPEYNPEKEFASMLVDALQYDDMDLTLRSFKTLVGLTAQDYTLTTVVSNAVVMTTEKMATLFFELKGEISEFRRLYKWTHEPTGRQKMQAVCTGLIDRCIQGEDTDEGQPSSVAQNVMRNLKLQDYTRQCLRLRIKMEKDVVALLSEVLKLVRCTTTLRGMIAKSFVFMQG